LSIFVKNDFEHLSVKKKKYVKFLKLLLVLGITILVIPFAVYLPPVQSFVISKIENNIAEKINAKVNIKEFDLSFFADIELKGVSVIKQKDTLLSVKKITIDIELNPLFDNKIIVDNIDINKLSGSLDKVLPQAEESQTSTQNNNKESYQIIVNNLNISNSDLSYFDKEMNMTMRFKVGNLKIENIKIDSFLVKAENIILENTWVDYISPYIAVAEEDIDTSVINLILQATNVFAKNSGFYYNDSLMKFKTGGNLRTNNLVVDLSKTSIVFDKGNLDNSFFNFIYINDTLDTIDIDDNFWNVRFNFAELKNSKFYYDVSYLPEDSNSFDYNHIHLDNINGSANNYFFSFHKMYGKLNSLAFTENNKIKFTDISGEIYTDDNILKMNNVEFVTNKSKLKLNGETGFYFYDYALKNNSNTNISIMANIDNWTGLEYFSAGSIKNIENYEKLKDKKTIVDAHFLGNTDSLHTKIKFDYNNTAYFFSQGIIKNISSKNPNYNLKINKLALSKQVLNLFVNKQTSEYTPNQMFVTGFLKGNLNKINFRGSLNSDYGKQNILLSSDFSEDKETLTAEITGNFYDNKTSGIKIDSLNININLKKFNIEKLVADVELKLKSVEIDSVSYDNLTANLKLEERSFKLLAQSKDSIIDFTLKSNGAFNDSITSGIAEINMNNFSMQQAKLFEKKYDIKFNSTTNWIYNFNNNYSKIYQHFTKLSTTDSIKTNSVEELDIDFSYDNKLTFFKLRSDSNFVRFSIKGSIDSLENNFYKLADILSLQRKKGDSLVFPDMELYAKFLNPNDLIGQTFSEYLPNYSKLLIDGKYKSKTGKFIFELTVPKFQYHGNSFDSTFVKFYGDRHFLDYKLSSNIQIDTILNTKIELDGKLKKQILYTHLNLKDKKRKSDFLNLNIESQKVANAYKIKIIDTALVILSKNWNIDKNNSFAINSKDLITQNINLFRNDKKIKIETDTIQNEIALILENIDLSVFNKILNNDTLLAGIANINLKSSYKNNIKNIRLTSDVSDFKYNNIYVGSLQLEKAILNQNYFAYDIRLNQSRKSIKSKGIINFNDAKKINANLEINSFDMLILQDMLKDYLYATNGKINSKIKITGNIDNPLFNGYLSFTDAQIGFKEINEVFKIGKEKIILENDKLFLDNLKLIDKNNQEIYFAGNIQYKNNNLTFNTVEVNAKGFEIMNSQYREENPIYGLVVADILLKANGKIDNLKMRTKISLDYPTNIKYVFPEDLSAENHSDMVNFTKIDTVQIFDSIAKQSINNYKQKLSVFDDLDAELEIKEGCKFNLFFDKSKENYFDAKVKGKIKYIVNRGISKTYGSIDILQGNMKYSMPMVTMNKLKVEDGSFIQINNNLENPYISVNASTKIWASTGNLIDDYNKNLEVSVFMFMRGNLDNLVMQFDISQETSDPLVSSKISQMSKNERSVNAVNLLVRGQFETSQNSASAIDINSYINSMFASGLNKLISDRVKFVDMNFDIKTFNNLNSSGAVENQSNLFFNVQKGFYNNRLRIKYTSNMTTTLTQQDEQVGQLNTYTQRNFFIEYDINKSGTFQSVLFRKDAYEDILEGDITSTGGGLKIRRNYNSFGDIFKFGGNKK